MAVSMRERLLRKTRPLRIRLTVAFASVVALVLAITAVLVYVQFAQDLSTRTDAELAERQAAIVGLATGRAPSAVLGLSGESLAQIYDAQGRVLAATRMVGAAPLLSPEEVGKALAGPIVLTRERVPGTDDGARVRAFALGDEEVAVIGEPLDARESELARLASLLAIAMPIALLLASLGGYQVAKAALTSVDDMRVRAATIGAGDLTQRLPEPGSGDELDRLAITLNDLLRRLEGALDRERRIVGDASHELRTPIAVLRTRVDVALRGDQSPQALRAALTDAGHDAERLSRLADDLLILARADQGALALRAEPLDVQDLLEDAVDRSIQVRPQVTISSRMSIDGGAVVLGDADRIAQVVDNLIANACRYGQPPIVVEASAGAGGTIELSVRDHGAGFPLDFADRAFERFSQADPSHGMEGTGLGLAIVRAIAQAHGGEVRAANHADGGAIVTVSLPSA